MNEQLHQPTTATAGLDIRRSVIQRFADALFGYDFFISYAHADGRAYAVALARGLQEKGFDVFLDSEDYLPGDDWERIGAWALKRTHRLALVGTPGALESKPVKRELEIYTEAGKRVIPIDIAGCLRSLAPDHPTASLLQDSVLRLQETEQRRLVGPSDEVLSELDRTFEGERQQAKRARWIRWTAAGMFLLLLALAAMTYRAVSANNELSKTLAESERRRERAEIEEGRAWVERAAYHVGRNDYFAAQLMAARAIGFVGVGREQQGPEFANAHPLLLRPSLSEWHEATRTLSKCAGNSLPIFQIALPGGPQASVEALAFSPDGRLLASGGASEAIKLWEVATGREAKSLTGHRAWVSSISFSPDGKLLASGAGDKTIKLWEVATGRELRTFTGHQDALNSVAFSPDGKLLASGCREAFHGKDTTIKLWEVATGRELRSLNGHQSYVNSVAFSPDGRTLASGSDDHEV